MAELDLEQIRQDIDKIDKDLAKVLEARLNLVMQVAAYKKSKGLPVKDVEREAKVINKVAGLVEREEYTGAVKSIMRSIIDEACLLEEVELGKVSEQVYEVACFGPAGSFTHQALDGFFKGRQYNRHHFNTFDEVILSVSEGKMDYAVMPIENSSTGGITEVYDLLRHHDCHIVGEQIVKIEQNLLGCAGASLQSIKTVYSHPQGFKQCKEFFQAYPDMDKVPFFSTSRSAEEVATKQDVSLGAVAGVAAAELYGLEVIAPSINTNKNNHTRFVVIAKNAEKVQDADKITLILSLKHESGSLYKLLASFYRAGLNLLNLESRPMEGKSWEYFFYIDVTGNLEDRIVADLVKELQEKSGYIKILGNYKAYKK